MRTTLRKWRREFRIKRTFVEDEPHSERRLVMKDKVIARINKTFYSNR